MSDFLREGDLRTLGSPLIVNVETPGEILSDKLRALMERPCTKGRDFFDTWFLTRTLGTRVDAEGLQNKLEMCAIPFSISTPPSFYANLETLAGKSRKALVKEISADLSRFLSAESLDTLSENEFHGLFEAAQEAFVSVLEAKNIDFSRFPTRGA